MKLAVHLCLRAPHTWGLCIVLLLPKNKRGKQAESAFCNILLLKLWDYEAAGFELMTNKERWLSI